MRRDLFANSAVGQLVPIAGVDPVRGEWTHAAFVPDPLPGESPELSGATYRAVADARASLAALDSTARSLPNPRLFRQATLRVEAQSTAALEGTYEPLMKVLAADDDAEKDPSLREVLNYLVVAEAAFGWSQERRALTVSMLGQLQERLMEGTRHRSSQTGRVRDVQVVIGRRQDADLNELPIKAAQFVPAPPGPDLTARLSDLLIWMSGDHRGRFDPVVAAALAHYQFEALHPFHDGNGRLGRLLIVVQLHHSGVLSEPTLSVSPWFEGHRADYFGCLMGVSTHGDWDSWVGFFARGLQASADQTRHRMEQLARVQADLTQQVAASTLRAGSARQLVDFAVGQPTFTVREAAAALNLSYGRTNKLVDSLVELGVLGHWGPAEYNRRFAAPTVIDVLLGSDPTRQST
ncbi:Fic family protein [Propioniciclava sinopodophylli]|uniref:Fic family protein n=1 Tax=Propioniciclava sinopodophylli TaxID=1837344 RepID=UPI0024927609|nr:Fic family protein [Propioniciclava sinopodophylli]